MRRKVWFKRFADIPGVDYADTSGLDRAKLAGLNAVPEISVYEFDGRQEESLLWPSRDGVTSGSPAHHRAFGDQKGATTAMLLANLQEGLELPGEPSDYHFLIQGCIGELWSRRKEEPEVLSKVEELCHLNIQLIEACPYAVSHEADGTRVFYGMQAFACLIDLYEKNGFLEQALAVADKAALFGQGTEDADDLRERIKAVKSEDD